MLLNIVCLPAGLWLADAGEVTRMLEVLSLYPLQLTPQGYAGAGKRWTGGGRMVAPRHTHAPAFQLAAHHV